MRLNKEQRQALQNHLLELILADKAGLVADTAERFEISRQSVSRYINRLIRKGLITRSGKGRGTKYNLVERGHFFKGDARILDENTIWREIIQPQLEAFNLPLNVLDICHYGATEMLNNVLDHAEAQIYLGSVAINALQVIIRIGDDGIGIFNRIQQEFKLKNPREAILELAKGKLTTDERHHTGEGIFFTSRIMDSFSMLSSNLFFMTNKGDDWLIEGRNYSKGTFITMEIRRDSPRTLEEIFKEYTSTDDLAFTKTVVPVSLLAGEDKAVFSRSQAKRLIWRFEKFKEIILNFNEIRTVGQAFTDEIFRVFALQHPDISIRWVNANHWVERMIKRALLKT